MSVATMSRWTKEPILGYVPKDYEKKNSRSKGLMNATCWSQMLSCIVIDFLHLTKLMAYFMSQIS